MNEIIFGRIAKFIAASGICSRREAEKFIASGLVKIDGKVINSPAINVSSNNIVTVDDAVVQIQDPPKLWIYHKPVGLITTHSDPQNRPTVFEALKNSLPRVISIGRLDLNSEGLLLLTNSGIVSREFELPKNNIERVYKARAHGDVSSFMNYIKQYSKQIKIDGVVYNPKKITLISKGQTNSWFEVILTEGKNREIRKIFEHFSLKVNRLIRIQYGEYKLGNLKPGEFKEVKDFNKVINKNKNIL